MTKTISQEPVIIEHKNMVTWLRLNRPDRLNAVNAAMIEGLIDGLTAAIERGSNLVVFAGEGRAFSAGFDLSGLDQQSDADLLYRFVRVEQLLQMIYQLPMTSVALVQGRCFGAAADIVASCRKRIAAPDASFRMPGLQFGIVLGTRRLARLIGADAAFDLLETSLIFTADDALGMAFYPISNQPKNGPPISTSWPVTLAIWAMMLKPPCLPQRVMMAGLTMILPRLCDRRQSPVWLIGFAPLSQHRLRNSLVRRDMPRQQFITIRPFTCLYLIKKGRRFGIKPLRVFEIKQMPRFWPN